MSDYNLQVINSNEMYENMRATIDFGGNIFIAGRRGSSKTMQAKQAIADSGMKEVYLNLSLFERVDMGGYPNFFNKENGGYINFLMPSFYKDLIEGDRPCVVILDEVDKCSADILAPLLEFTQFHTINGAPLKNYRASIMTGNLTAEGGQRPPLPLLDRSEKFLVQVDPQHWLDWGSISRAIHPSVSAYISDNKTDLYGDVDPGEVYADPSPRGWHNASKLLFFGEDRNWNHQMMQHKVSACVGKKAGMKYSSFFTHYQEILPVVGKVMNGEKAPEFSSFEKTKQLIVGMTVCQRFAGIIDNTINQPADAGARRGFSFSQKDKLTSDNVSKFMTNMDQEMALVAIRSQIGPQRTLAAKLLEDPNWDGIMTLLLKRIKN